jgi:maleylpyruvate isomerase
MRSAPADGLPATDVLLDWVQEGQDLLSQAVVASLSDQSVGQPSGLPGWTRGHVLTHLSRNADALVNLLTWARTGVPTPMYASSDQRNSDIEAGSRRGLGAQLDDVADSARRLMQTARALEADHWGAQVRSAQGRDIAASQVPWMRVREVWIHLVDLRVGVDFDAVPEPIARALVQDVARWMDSRVEQRMQLVGQLPDVVFGGSAGQPAVRVQGSPQALAAWLIGRSRGEGLEVDPPGPVPDLPSWL